MRPARGVSPAAGFTLVEVLLGLALLALVLTLIQGVYAGALRSRDRAQEQAEKSHAAALVLQRMADELGSALPSSGTQGDAGHDLVLEADENLDSKLEFSALLPVSLQEADANESGGLARIAYRLERADDGTRTLVRIDSRNPAGSAAEGETSQGDALLRGVSRFRVRLLVGEDKWRESSSGADAAEGPARGVSIELAWKEGTNTDSPTRALRTLVPLYPALEQP